MRPSQVVRRAADYLDRHDVESPMPTAEMLLASVLGIDRIALYARDEGLSSEEARRFGRALCRRCAGTPTQHITGVQGFRRLVVQVRPGVFVPRPETEVLVEAALQAIQNVERPSVVDIGTGTGAIALAIKSERPDAQVTATDVSLDAVALARDNARGLGLELDVRCGDLLDALPLELRGVVDLVVSNPPYVAADDLERLPLEVRADPRAALVGGIEIYERLFASAAGWLRSPGGVVAVELHESRARAVGRAVSEAGFDGVRIERDLAGRDRVLTAVKHA